MLLLLLLLLPVTAGFTIESPQRRCLDSLSPFEPVTPLSFCTEYGSAGCCTSANDEDLQARSDYIQSKASSSEWSRCQSFVRDILCQQCSPYAAGIFDQTRTFPGLCISYCHEFYDKCRNLLWFLAPDLARESVLDNRDRFCTRVAVDAAVCYPDVTSLPQSSEPTSPRCVCLEPTNRWLSMPVWAGHAGDGSGRLFVVEQRGKVSIFDTRNRKWRHRPFLDIRHRVLVAPDLGDERGLLSLAFHPDHANNRRFFLFYTFPVFPWETLPDEYKGRQFSFNFKVRVSEMRVRDNDRNRVEPFSEKVLLEVYQPFWYHNGGSMFFGVDGYLYISFGDGGGGGDPFQASQNKLCFKEKWRRMGNLKLIANNKNAHDISR